MAEFGPDLIIEIETNPETGRHTSVEESIEKTAQDVEARLAELNRAILDEEARLIEQTKAELEKAHANWRSAQKLKEEGVYTQQEIDARHDRVKELKMQLRELTKDA